MSTIQIQTSVEQLLDAVSQLPPEEIASITEKIIALRASHISPHIEKDESDLLMQINQALPTDIRFRYKELIGKRQAETLSDAEYEELIHLTEQIEQRETERVTALAALARLRRVSLSDLMTALDISTSILN